MQIGRTLFGNQISEFYEPEQPFRWNQTRHPFVPDLMISAYQPNDQTNPEIDIQVSEYDRRPRPWLRRPDRPGDQ
ncbi:hypothetical protein U1Q18_010514 [Sarracenia purpurea var. burkii]